jgi:hypothetical protein
MFSIPSGWNQSKKSWSRAGVQPGKYARSTATQPPVRQHQVDLLRATSLDGRPWSPDIFAGVTSCGESGQLRRGGILVA